VCAGQDISFFGQYPFSFTDAHCTPPGRSLAGHDGLLTVSAVRMSIRIACPLSGVRIRFAFIRVVSALLVGRTVFAYIDQKNFGSHGTIPRAG
jgi:hypothetical protein